MSRASPQRIAMLGLGVVATILVGYLAQSSLAGQQGSMVGAALYGLAMLGWLGLLLFEFATPDGGLLRRGPRTTGGGPARPLPGSSAGANLIVRASLAVLALTLSIATYVLTANNALTLPVL